MKQINDETFDRDITTADVALVMFSAPWAGPCNMVRPAFEAAASRFGNQIEFGEFVLDDNPEIPETYGVKQVPSFYLLRRGIPDSVTAGAVPEETLMELCREAVG